PLTSFGTLDSTRHVESRGSLAVRLLPSYPWVHSLADWPAEDLESEAAAPRPMEDVGVLLEGYGSRHVGDSGRRQSVTVRSVVT
ncbi:MAG: hypothetical protein V5A43_11875, partial [Haloarculaceae archaeon]